jgi:hypothetical protein
MMDAELDSLLFLITRKWIADVLTGVPVMPMIDFDDLLT